MALFTMRWGMPKAEKGRFFRLKSNVLPMLLTEMFATSSGYETKCRTVSLISWSSPQVNTHTAAMTALPLCH